MADQHNDERIERLVGAAYQLGKYAAVKELEADGTIKKIAPIFATVIENHGHHLNALLDETAYQLEVELGTKKATDNMHQGWLPDKD